MGGDKAPEEIAKGILLAAREYGLRVAMVGPKAVTGNYLDRNSNGSNVFAVDASQVVDMAESPTDAYRDKPDSSMAVGIRMLKEGNADAFVSAGNTGAMVAAGLLTLGTLTDVDRPAISTLYTTTAGTLALLLDIGANADCRAAFLQQFAQMGSDYMAKVFKVPSPRVGLLSNGSEESKGSRLVKETNQLLKKSNLNYVGYVEGFDLFRGEVDVIVTDGFTGNVVLKIAEALTESIFTSLKDSLSAHPLAMASKFLWGPPIKSAARQWDYTNVGGAPLLGINGNIVKAHGRSDADDLKNAIGLAQRMVREGWVAPLVQRA